MARSGRRGQWRPAGGIPCAARRLVFELPAKPGAVPAARRALLACNGELPSSIRDDVLLLVTELVSNAVRHAEPGADRAVRVELQGDGGAGGGGAGRGPRGGVCAPGRPPAAGGRVGGVRPLLAIAPGI